MPQSHLDLSSPSLLSAFSSIREAIQENQRPIHISGLGSSTTKAFWITLLCKATQKNALLITESIKEGQKLFYDLQFFSQIFNGNSENIRLFPGGENPPYENKHPSVESQTTRIATKVHLLEDKPFLIITSIQALLEGGIQRSVLKRCLRNIQIKESLSQEYLLSELEAMGYTMESKVEKIGECSIRGGILDIFSPALEKPVRLEYWGDTIESIRHFDPTTQRSTETLSSIQIQPVQELVLNKECLQTGWGNFQKRGKHLGLSPYHIEGQWEQINQRPLQAGAERFAPFLMPLESLLDFIPSDTMILLDEKDQLEKQTDDFLHKAQNTYSGLLQEGYVLPTPEELYPNPFMAISHKHPVFYLERFKHPETSEQTSFSMNFRSIENLGFQTRGVIFNAQVELLKKLKETHLILLVCRTSSQLERLQGLFSEHDLPALSLDPSENKAFTPSLSSDLEHISSLFEKMHENHKPDQSLPLLLLKGDLSKGFLVPQLNLMFLTEEEFLGHRIKHRPVSKSKIQAFLPDFDELEPQDWVVHLAHGIGQYIGLERLPIQGSHREFMVIQYSGNDKLYVPLDHLDQVQPYTGVDGLSPKMDRFGGTTWTKTKQKVKKELEEVAEELLQLYAARDSVKGYAFPPDSSLSKEFEATFEYEETPDQLRAIQDVIRDLEQPKPMDRLICGDVGYGKTEIALRAAYKVVEDNKQVALLSPTTLLAQQHFQTFSQRFESFPVSVEMLSRFRSKQEQKEIIKKLNDGQMDIIIGTHRLLQKDIQFRDLGLVIIDEEQRFGVTHKEYLKQLRTRVDVLTLTATPIPRTLQFSLIGARDLSIIETAPADRLAIQTFTLPFNQSVIQEGIQRELDRSGQVFFVHNRVHNIEGMATMIKTLFPKASIGIAHGQMHERKLQEVMRRFVQKECQILVCTSIIESGLDIPDANTIFINRADQFGLSELYQLRGRVGRSGNQAYAYLMVPQEKALTREAKKRLQALQDFTELGAGFRIAARDLEIRGAGNILGKKQSGHIAVLGFEFYQEMIAKTMREMKGEKIEEELDPILNLSISPFFPEEYIPETHQRLSIYKRISSVQKEEDLSVLKEEIIDRFGPLPEAAQQLLQVIEIKAYCKILRIVRLDTLSNGIRFTLDPSHHVSQKGLNHLMMAYQGMIQFQSEYVFQLLEKPNKWEEEYQTLKNCLAILQEDAR